MQVDNGVRIAKEKEGEILDAFFARSDEIRIPGFINRKYNEFADSYLLDYLNTLKGRESFIYKVINTILRNRLRTQATFMKYDDRHLIALWNWIDCEAHKELLLRGIQRQIEKINNR